MVTKNFHALSRETVEQEIQTSPSQGLRDAEVHKRQKIFGKNVLEINTISPFQIFIKQLNSPLIFILFFAACISLVLKEVTDFFTIFGIIVINAIVGFWQEMKANASLEALRSMTETKNMVIRSGKMRLIPSSELVPGDILIFHQGEVVTADVRLLESSGLMVDEATLTGESIPVIKQHEEILPESALPFEWTNMLLSGSTVVRGTGRGVVVRTGASTYLATIGERAKEASPETPLQRALKKFSKRYVLLLICLIGSLAILGFFQGHSPLNLLYFLLASLVSAVPEGLPLVVTVVMALGAVRLRKQQTLVRDLPSVETLGSTTVIATDKTGTITEGKLLVQETYALNLSSLQRIAALCNDAHEGLGDPLDVALSDWVENTSELRTRYPKKWQLDFDSSLMLMATINEIDGRDTLLVKGAYESLRKKAQNQTNLEEIDATFHKFLKKGYRVLAFGEGIQTQKDPNKWDLTITGLIGFIDPPKKGVHHAVTAAKKAGIHIIMITGDHPITAQTIAHEVGIWQKNDRILTGQEIEKLTDEELRSELIHTTVLARILPEHKYRIVKVLQSKEEIVAVTGDGVNDIPALKAAHIGIAMGNGAEAAKGVSQMVLVDNNFTVIVDAIKNARVIAGNIRKVIYYLVSTSLQELSFLCLTIFSGVPIPLSAIQILWINLVTDGVMDKTFPFAKEEGNVMERPPRKVSETFFDRLQMKRILFFGLLQGIFCFYLYLYLYPKYPFQEVSTIIFTSVVCAQWANALQAQKSKEPFFKNIKTSFSINPITFYVLPLGIVLQLSVIYLFPALFKSTPLTLEMWFFPLLNFTVAFLIVELRKWIEYFGTCRNQRTQIAPHSQ